MSRRPGDQLIRINYRTEGSFESCEGYCIPYEKYTMLHGPCRVVVVLMNVQVAWMP